MTFKVNLGDGETTWWSKHHTEQTLWKLSNVDKKVEWIRADLSTSESNWFSRMMWGIAKHFEWMRTAFYGVDLERSREILNELRPQIAGQYDKAMINIFNKAVNNFNTIAPNHWVETIYEYNQNYGHEEPNTPYYLPEEPKVTPQSPPSSPSKAGLFGPALTPDPTPVHQPLFGKQGSSDKPADSLLGSLTSSFVKTSSSVSASLLSQLAPYNHGKLNYNDAAKLIEHPAHKPGAYLIRQSWDSDFMVVSVMAPNKKNLNIRFKIINDKFRNEDGKEFATLPELVKERGAELLYPIRQGSAHPSHPDGMIQAATPSTKSEDKIQGLFDQEPAIISQPPSPVIPKKSVEEEFEQALKDGTDIDELLHKAFQEYRPAVCAWLLAKGASLEKLEAKVLTQSVHGQTAFEKAEALMKWLHTVAEKVDATPENLDHFALDLALGYKSANLMVMERKAEEMSKHLKSSIVKVPPFLPVGNFELSHYLLSEIPQVLELWEQFKNTFDGAAKKSFLAAETNEKASKSGMKITTAGDKILAQIGELIQDHFRKNPYHSLQMREWLEKEKPKFVIVRSTGKEDSDTNSNAGGNASIPYVKPDADSISEAIGEVIASYFGERSINQRILCGDRSLITDQKPFMPILIQEMVGENVDGQGSKNEDIPRSGVLFTRQNDKAEGVTFIQTGLGNNEGVVSSQVGVDSYFVKEGKIHAIVRDKETRFVSTKNVVGKMTVVPIKNNNEALQKSQALHPRIIFDIKSVADDISETYAQKSGSPKPMDMEYTVKLKEKGYTKPVIYLLQARPLLSTKGDEKMKPSYLDLQGLKDIEDKRKITAEVLLDGNAHVRRITDMSSVIFADDLPKGEYDYAHTSDDVKVIFIKKTAPATSHEAVILRPKGVAVLVIDNPDEFAKLKKMVGEVSKETPVLVDTQRGLIVSCPTEESGGTLVKEGLVSYPIPLEVTVPPSLYLERLDQAGKIKSKEQREALIKGDLQAFNFSATSLIDQLRGVKTELVLADGTHVDPSKVDIKTVDFTKTKTVKTGGVELLSLKDGGYDINELFDLMATGDAGQAKLALATILDAMRKRLTLSLKETEKSRKHLFRPMFQILEYAIYLARKEIIPAIEKHPAQSLERLYPIKFLNALVFQKANQNVMGGYSYVQVLSEDKAQKKALSVAKQLGIQFDGPNADSLIKLQQLIGRAFNEESSANWQAFVRDLSKADVALQGNLISRIAPIINQASILEIAPMWMNTTFNNAWKANSAKSGPTRLEAVVKSLELSRNQDAATFAWIQERLDFVAGYEKGTNAWIEPATAKKNTQKLIDDFTGKFGFDPTGSSANSLKARFNGAQALGKLALLQYIRRAVNAYDCTIKAVKGSDKFKSDKDKALQVADMLEGYLRMMESTFSLISSSEQQAMQSVKMGSPVLFPDYIHKLKNGCSYNFGFSTTYTSSGFNPLVAKLRTGAINASEQLESRPQFAVDSLVVGSKADLNFSTHWPDRLEEYFTTFHQNMEQVVKYLNTKNGLDTSLLAKQAKEICEKSTGKFGQNISSLTILENGKLRIGYQIPLRQHSASLMIDYDPQNTEKGAEITVQMFGNDEHYRWDQAAAFGSILAFAFGNGFANGTAPKINYAKPEGSEFSIKVPGTFANVDQLMTTIHYITKTMTMGSIGGAQNLVQQIKHYIPAINWSALDPEAYKYSLYINRTLIDQLQGSQPQTAAQIAISSILGIAHYGIADYTRDGASLLTKSLQTIKAQLPTTPAILLDVQALIKDPQVQKKLPHVVSEIKGELAKMKPPEEAFESLMQSKDFLEAITLALKTKIPSLRTKVEAFIAAKLQGNETDLLLDLFIKLNSKGFETEAETLIMKQGLESKLTPDQVDKLQILKQKELRAGLLANLQANVSKLQSLVGNFETNHQEIMTLCRDAMIGLSQSSEYQGKSFGEFQHLGGYLGGAAYNYVYDNGYGNTSKLRKAGPFYLIKGFESKNPDVRNSAVEAFKKLALDYALFAKHEGHVDAINEVMFALARAFMDTTQPTKVAAREIFLMFQKDKSILQKMLASGKIPAGPKSQALVEMLSK